MRICNAPPERPRVRVRGKADAVRYRVTYMERTNAVGEPSEVPPDYVAIDVPDSVVIDQRFVERTAPLAMHNQEKFDEDDDFLSVGSETWDYDVKNGREDEFLAAVENSQIAIECVPLGDSDAP